MRYETIQKIKFPKIGFGTWTIGGERTADFGQDERSLFALHSALDLGYLAIDTAEGYAQGHCEELIGKVLQEKMSLREQLFITSKVSPDHLHYDGVLHSCENSLRRLGISYLDCYLIHWPSRIISLEETMRAMNRLVREGKIRFIGVSNFNLKQLKNAVKFSDTPIFTNQVSYSIPDRTCVKNGVLEYCQNNNILLTAYTPVKRRFIAGNASLRQLALEKGISPHQLALAWLASQDRVAAIPMSFNPDHQKQNLQAGDIVLTPEDFLKLKI